MKEINKFLEIAKKCNLIVNEIVSNNQSFYSLQYGKFYEVIQLVFNENTNHNDFFKFHCKIERYIKNQIKKDGYLWSDKYKIRIKFAPSEYGVNIFVFANDNKIVPTNISEIGLIYYNSDNNISYDILPNNAYFK